MTRADVDFTLKDAQNLHYQCEITYACSFFCSEPHREGS